MEPPLLINSEQNMSTIYDENWCVRVCVCGTAGPVLMSLKEGYSRPSKLVFKAPVKEKKSVVVNGIDLLENVPPRTENEVPVLCMHTTMKKEAF